MHVMAFVVFTISGCYYDEGQSPNVWGIGLSPSLFGVRI